MKYFTVAALAGFAAASSEVESAFFGYITQYGKSYGSMEEYEFRLAQFARNHAIIAEHNVKESSFKLGHNKMSDWSEEEYHAILTYKDQPTLVTDFIVNDTYDPIDWRAADKKAVNDVQDQGHCGSCWAFSTVATMEGAHFQASGKLEKFAEQQPVDCVTACFGCHGGNPTIAIRYYKEHDAMLEKDYPYTAQGGHCDYQQGSGIRGKGSVAVAAENIDAMKAALNENVLSVAIQANKAVFQNYKEGIFDDEGCGGLNLDHATNVVGWGKDETKGDYWIMRNSWGTTWGEEGYMRMKIQDGRGICGVQKQPISALSD
jgi:cathepsin L